jgi:hypothetical protein
MLPSAQRNNFNDSMKYLQTARRTVIYDDVELMISTPAAILDVALRRPPTFRYLRLLCHEERLR